MDEKLYYQPTGRGYFEAWTYNDGNTVYVIRNVDENEIRQYAKKYGYRTVFVAPLPKNETPTRRTEDYEYRWRKERPGEYSVWVVSSYTGDPKEVVSTHTTSRGAMAAIRKLYERRER